MKIYKKKIPKDLYRKFVSFLPIVCVDIIIFDKGKVLLVKRGNEPAKNKWWLPGGRVLKGERLLSTAKRKVNEEVGLKIKIKKFVGVYETKFKKGLSGVTNGTHTINCVFLAEPFKKNSIKLDQDHKDWKWFKKVDSSWPTYIKKCIRDAKIFNK